MRNKGAFFLFLLFFCCFSKAEVNCIQTHSSWTLPYPWIKFFQSQKSGFYLPLPPGTCLSFKTEIKNEAGNIVGQLVVKETKNIPFSSLNVDIARSGTLLDSFKRSFRKQFNRTRLFDFVEQFFITQVQDGFFITKNAQGGFGRLNLAQVKFRRNKNYQRPWNRFSHYVQNPNIPVMNFQETVNALRQPNSMVIETTGKQVNRPEVWRLPKSTPFFTTPPTVPKGALDIEEHIYLCKKLQAKLKENDKNKDNNDKIIIYGALPDTLSHYNAAFCIPKNKKNRLVTLENIITGWNNKPKHIRPFLDIKPYYIDYKKLQSLLKNPFSVLLDTQGRIAYAMERIPKAHQLKLTKSPFGHIFAYNLKDYNRTQNIIVYGHDATDVKAGDVVRSLVRRRYNVHFYTGGLEDWVHRGLPLEGSLHPKKTKPRKK